MDDSNGTTDTGSTLSTQGIPFVILCVLRVFVVLKFLCSMKVGSAYKNSKSEIVNRKSSFAHNRYLIELLQPIT